MTIRHRFIAVCALVLFAAWPVVTMAQSWTPGVWHQYTPSSPHFDPSTGDRHGAGIKMEDDLAALVLLYPDENEGAQIIVELTGWLAAAEITSRLFKADGSALVLRLPEDRFVVSNSPNPATNYYTFNVAHGDLENFMAASRWELETSSGITKFPLKGSRDALSAAIRDRAAGIPQQRKNWIEESRQPIAIDRRI